MPLRSRIRTDEGIGLIDVMVAFTILLVVLAPLGNLLVSQIHYAVTTQQRLAANDLMDTWLGKLQSQGPFWQSNSSSGGLAVIGADEMDQWLPLGGAQDDTTTMNGVTLTSTVMYRWEAQNANPNLCAAAATGSGYLMTATVQVSWAKGQSVEGTEVLSFPSSSSNDGTGSDVGYIALQVTGINAPDASGVPWSTRVAKTPVTVLQQATQSSGTYTSFTVYPDANGCVFMAVPTAPSPGLGYQVELQSTAPAPGVPPDVAAPQGVPAPGPLPSTVWVCAPTYAAQPCTGPTSKTQVSYDIVGGEVADLGTVGYDEGVLVNAHYANSTTVAGGMTCPAGLSAITCYVTGPSGDGTAFAWMSASTWQQVDVPGLTSLAEAACMPSTTSDVCLLAGSGPGPSGVLDSLLVTSTSATVRTDTLPFASSGLTGVSCPTHQSPMRCVVTSAGGGAANQVIADGAISASSPDTWWPVNDYLYGTTTTPALTSATGVSCLPGADDGCGVTGVGSAGTPLLVSGLTSATGTPTSWYSQNPSGMNGITISSIQSIECVTAYGCLVPATGQASAGAAVTPLLLGFEPLNTTNTSSTYVVNGSGYFSGYTGLTGLACTGDEPGVVYPGCIIEWSSSTSTAPRAAILMMYGYVPLNGGSVVPSGATAMSTPVCSPTACGVAAEVSGTWGVDTSPVPSTLNLSSSDLTVSWTAHSETLGANIPSSPVCGPSVCVNAAAPPPSTTADTSVAVFSGSQTASSWAQTTMPAAADMVSLVGSGCSTTACTLVGIAPQGAADYVLPQAGTNPISASILPVGGVIGPDIPLALTNPSFPSGGVWYENLGAGTSPATPTQSSFTVAPEAQPYSLAATGCLAGMTSLDTTSLTATTPGATVDLPIPLGVLNLEVETSAGTPAANASVTFILSACGLATPITASATGRIFAAVPIGTYSVIVPSGTTASVTVTPAAQSSGTTVVSPLQQLTIQ